MRTTSDIRPLPVPAERSKPEVVVVDLELPAIHGLDVARRFREAYGKQMRLIVKTAWPDNAETHSKPADAGFDDVLIKPTSVFKILKAIQHGGGHPVLKSHAEAPDPSE